MHKVVSKKQSWLVAAVQNNILYDVLGIHLAPKYGKSTKKQYIQSVVSEMHKSVFIADMPTSGNTNLYFEAHKPVFFNKNLYFFKNIHKQASFTSFYNSHLYNQHCNTFYASQQVR